MREKRTEGEGGRGISEIYAKTISGCPLAKAERG